MAAPEAKAAADLQTLRPLAADSDASAVKKVRISPRLDSNQGSSTLRADALTALLRRQMRERPRNAR